MSDYEQEFIEKYLSVGFNTKLQYEIEAYLALIDYDKLSIKNLDSFQSKIHLAFIRISNIRSSKVNKLNEEIKGM